MFGINRRGSFQNIKFNFDDWSVYEQWTHTRLISVIGYLIRWDSQETHHPFTTPNILWYVVSVTWYLHDHFTNCIPINWDPRNRDIVFLLSSPNIQRSKNITFHKI